MAIFINNPQQKEQEIKIIVPEGYEIDKENSTFECIKFKKKETRWRDSKSNMTGYWITGDSRIAIANGPNKHANKNVFATEKQAKSALAMAQISQIMANDERFGGPLTNEEWNSNSPKFIICRNGNGLFVDVTTFKRYHFLAFHTVQQCDSFLKENEDLVKDYLMID